MLSSPIVIIGAGLGGLSTALELRRRGYEVLVLERHSAVGGKARERTELGFRWDRGPSIVVMPWVYRELFAASGLDPEAYLPLVRLDPAFRIILSDGRPADYDDGGDERYLHEDTRMAVKEAVDRGVHPFCITLDPSGGKYLAQIFGAGHYLVLDHVNDLPKKLPEVYLRLRK